MLKVYIDLMYMGGAPVVRIVDDTTQFRAAQFVSPLTTKSDYEAILILWTPGYTGSPNTLVFDNSSRIRYNFV